MCFLDTSRDSASTAALNSPFQCWATFSKKEFSPTSNLLFHQDMVTATRSQIAAHLQESEEQNQHIQEEKDHAVQKLQKLRAAISQAGATAHTHLVTLTCQCSATLKALQQVVEKVSWAALSGDVPVPSVLLSLPTCLSWRPPTQAQRILRLAEMCRRLETEEEKVLPFYPSSLAEWEQQDVRRILAASPNEPLARVRRHRRAPRGTRVVIRPWGSPSWCLGRLETPNSPRCLPPGHAGLRGAGAVLAAVQQGEAGGEGAGAGAGNAGKQEPAPA